jgi:cation:H+ antiporter
VLVAITTSLPEISTTLSAVKLQKYDMALSNIFGTNLFDISLIFIADLFYLKGPVLAELDNFAVISVFLGIAITGRVDLQQRDSVELLCGKNE